MALLLPGAIGLLSLSAPPQVQSANAVDKKPAPQSAKSVVVADKAAGITAKLNTQTKSKQLMPPETEKRTGAVSANSSVTGARAVSGAGAAPRGTTTAKAKAVAGSSATSGADAARGAGLTRPDGYALYQTSSIMGDHDVWVGSKSVKIMDRKVGMGILATAPDWRVKCFNGDTQRIYTTTMRKYHGSEHEIRALAGGTTVKDLPLKQTRSYTANGIVINEYKTTKQFESKQEKDLERESADPLFVKSAIMETVPKSGVPRQAAILISRFYGVPETGDLPLKFSYINLKGDLHSILVLNSAAKIKTNPDTFAIPAGYTAVKELNQLEDKAGHKPFKRKVIETIKKIK